MKIGFLSNQLDNRGTGNALFNYAHYNEEILGNKSKIFTFSTPEHDQLVVDKFASRFGQIYLPTNEDLSDCDALYHIKSGIPSGVNPPIPYLVHAVFESEPHGDRYAAVSEWMGIRDNIPFVPHIVQHPDVKENLRKGMKISKEATVFGRIGGPDTFDIPWVWDAIEDVLELKQDYWFVFVGTNLGIKHPRVIYYPPVINSKAKRAFINSCDAMIHARARGETFGISVGEFSVLGKPIFTYGKSYEKAHIYELKGTAKTYEDYAGLLHLLLEYNKEPAHPFYNYPPELVMAKFKEVFLD